MSKPIKVLVVISNLTHGGAERQVVELANRVDPVRVELHVCSLSNYCPLAKFLKFPDKFHVLEKKAKYDVSLIFKLASFLRKNKFDLVHGFLYDAELASRLAGFLAGTQVVVGSERNSNNNFGRLKTLIYTWTSGCMDMCVANSSAGAEFGQKAFAIPQKKYAVIHNGVDTQRFCSRESTMTRQDLGVSGNTKIVGMVGSYKRQKNHAFLVEAIAEVKKQYKDVVFVFVGSVIKEGPEATTEYYDSVQACVERLDVRDMCVFVDARNDIEEFFNLCDFTVLPSLFEGTPNVVLESLACAVPVIATDVADNRFVIPDEKAGYIVPLGEVAILAEKILDLLGDEEKLSAMSDYARTWVCEQFGLDKMAGKFEDIYYKLLSEQQS